MSSFRREVLKNGANYNILTVVMAHNRTDLAGSLQWVSDRYDQLITEFLEISENILGYKTGDASWDDEVYRQVGIYIDMLGVLYARVLLLHIEILSLGQFVRGNENWNFMSER